MKNRTSSSAERKKKRPAQPNTAPRRTKKRSGRRALYAVPVFLLILLVGAILSYTVLFKLKTISVSGSGRYTSDEVTSASGLVLDTPLLKIKTADAVQAIKAALPYAETVTVRRSFPSTLEITVLDPELTAAVRLSDGESVLLSGLGNVLERNYTGDAAEYRLSDEISVFSDIASCANNENFLRANTVQRALIEKGIKGVSVIASFSGADVSFLWNSRVAVKLGGVSDIDTKMKFVSSFLENNLGENETGVVDISDPKKLRFNPGELREGLLDEQNATEAQSVVSMSESSDENSAE